MLVLDFNAGRVVIVGQARTFLFVGTSCKEMGDSCRQIESWNLNLSKDNKVQRQQN